MRISSENLRLIFVFVDLMAQNFLLPCGPCKCIQISLIDLLFFTWIYTKSFKPIDLFDFMHDGKRLFNENFLTKSFTKRAQDRGMKLRKLQIDVKRSDF